MMRLRRRAKCSRTEGYPLFQLNQFRYDLAFSYLIFLCFLDMSRSATENRMALFLDIEQTLMSSQEIGTAAKKDLDIIFG
jgi:hypothetical protein